MAIVSSILTAVDHMILKNEPCADLGFEHYQRSDRDRLIRQSVARLQKLGFRVTLEATAA